MIADLIMWAIGLVVAIAVPSFGWLVSLVLGKIDDVAKDHKLVVRGLSEHKLHAAETFATKLEVKDGLDRIMDKLDSMDDKLDRKQDK